MSAPLIALVGLIYAGVCVDQFIKGSVPWALVYFGYAVANIGSILLLR